MDDAMFFLFSLFPVLTSGERLFTLRPGGFYGGLDNQQGILDTGKRHGQTTHQQYALHWVVYRFLFPSAGTAGIGSGMDGWRGVSSWQTLTG
ncbi:hypothetical protein B0T22DRAFT_165265 [Podospora appendiculata]|uniref:Uncharacterized protein n=1 Tax=Podospora appendiculata TaxID=314037 RepID=A0AAE1CCX4_9PEZI|nr:hypothetical protein B0T22DRAFT_165265 [Podospora appendiculata]